MPERIAKKVLLIGWDAADWQMISPLLDAGRMPALSGLVDRGVMGNIATLHPCLSPLLWTSIATGKFPDKHGILGFVEPDGEGGVRLASSASRKTKAIWNILSQNGLHANVIGWFASHPAEPINGVCVSNLFDQNPTRPGEFWPLVADAVHPAKWREPVAEFRLHPAEISGDDVRRFIPRLDEIDLKTDSRPGELARCLAHCAGIHAIATAVMENEPWDLMAVYYDMLDVAGHVFMPYHPPHREHVPPRDFELYSGVMHAAYEFHDQMLARLLELAGDDTTVVLVSDHGFLSDHRRPLALHGGDNAESLAAHWHRQFGVLCIAGAGIKVDERIHGATLLDVAPTVLTLLGVPYSADMDGRPLVQAFERPPEISPIASWDAVPGAAGMLPLECRIDPVAAESTIAHLISLGYLEPSANHADAAVRTATDEANFNLAGVYLHSNRPAQALPLLQQLCEAWPDNNRYLLAQAQAYASGRRPAEARRALESLESRGMRGADLDAMLAAALFELGEPEAALARLAESRRSAPESLAVLSVLAKIQQRRGQWPDAEQALRQMIEIEPESYHAHNDLAGVLIEQGDFARAAEHSMQALAIVHFFPAAHYHLGVALLGLEQIDQAIQSLQYAVKMAPDFSAAHRRLAALFQQLGDPLKALRHERAGAGIIESGDAPFPYKS